MSTSIKLAALALILAFAAGAQTSQVIVCDQSATPVCVTIAGTTGGGVAINGGMLAGGPNQNLGTPCATPSTALSWLQNTGQTALGWNCSNGNGETDLIANRGSLSGGGFSFYDYSNSGTLTHLVDFNPATGENLWTNLIPAVGGLTIGSTTQSFAYSYVGYSVVNYLDFYNAGFGFTGPHIQLGYDGSGNLAVSSVPTGELWAWSPAGQQISYWDVVPYAPDARNLGSTGQEWLNVYAKNLTVTGTCTGCGGVGGGSGPYLLLTGGTMTGDILASGTPSLGSATNAFQYGYIYEPLVNYLQFFSSGYTGSHITFGYDGSGNLAVTATPLGELWAWSPAGQQISYWDVVPYAADARNLGSTGEEWLNVYAKNLTVTGTCTGCGGAYLPLTGGTMRGDILASGTPSLGSATNAFQYGYIYEPLVNYLQFFSSGYTGSHITFGYDGSGNLAVTATPLGELWAWSPAGQQISYWDVVPYAADARNLGSTGEEWLNVYAKNLTVTGTCTGCGGAYLPLAGGYMTGSIFPATTNYSDLGATTLYWRGLYTINAAITNASISNLTVSACTGCGASPPPQFNTIAYLSPITSISRSFGSVYTNSLWGKPLMLMATASNGTAYQYALTGYVNGNVVAFQDVVAGGAAELAFMVPNGATYEVIAPGLVQVYWNEAY